MQQRRRARVGREHILQAICILLLLILLVGILLSESLRTANTPTQSAQTVAFCETDVLEGYVFRDETAILSKNNGVVDYRVRGGEIVTEGACLVKEYRDESGTDQRERAAALLEEKERLLGALENEQAWQPDYTASYAALMTALSGGDLQGTADGRATLTDALCRRAATASEAQTYAARIAAIDAEIAEMVQYVNNPIQHTASVNGAFYRVTDGYEASFGLSAVADLTPESLTALLDAPLDEECIGKVVSCGEWYLAVPTTAQIAAAYDVEQTCTVSFAVQNTTLPMRLVAIRPSEDGAGALLLFYADQKPAWLGAVRRLSVTVAHTPLTGLSIPASALQTENGVRGVYVAENGVARWRRVELLYERSGCVIVASASGEGVLHEGEAVIVTARRLYDGKTLR